MKRLLLLHKLTSWQISKAKVEMGNIRYSFYTFDFYNFDLPILLIDEFIENKWAQLALIIFGLGI